MSHDSIFFTIHSVPFTANLHCIGSRLDTYHLVVTAMITDLLPWIPIHLPNHTVTVIQFSGIAQLESSYKPGSFGKTEIADCNMYDILLETSFLDVNFNFDHLLNSQGKHINSVYSVLSILTYI